MSKGKAVRFSFDIGGKRGADRKDLREQEGNFPPSHFILSEYTGNFQYVPVIVHKIFCMDFQNDMAAHFLLESGRISGLRHLPEAR